MLFGPKRLGELGIVRANHAVQREGDKVLCKGDQGSTLSHAKEQEKEAALCSLAQRAKSRIFDQTRRTVACPRERCPPSNRSAASLLRNERTQTVSGALLSLTRTSPTGIGVTHPLIGSLPQALVTCPVVKVPLCERRRKFRRPKGEQVAKMKGCTRRSPVISAW